MSQVQTRPSLSATSPRGRGSSRGGRGGSSFTSRGGFRGAARNSNNSNGDSFDNEDPIEDQGEFGTLKKKYTTQLAQLRELFPALSSQEILLELKESNGNTAITADKLTEVSAAQAQWEVQKKNQGRSRSKAQQEPVATSTQHESLHSSRGARGGRTSFDGARPGRGRGGSEARGGRGGRGRGGPSNGVFRQQPRASGSSDATTSAPEGGEALQMQADASGDKKEDDAAEAPVAPPKKLWASLLKPALPPPAPRPVPQKVAPPPQPAPEKAPTPPKEPEPTVEPAVEAPVEEPVEEPEATASETPVEEPAAVEGSKVEPELEVSEALPVEAEELPQELTEDNVEKLENAAPPPPTETQAGTVATSIAPDSTPTTTTPKVQAATPVLSNKYPAPKGTPRHPFRRVLDQQEGVVMPGNHGEMARTALQFGSMGLNGDLDDEDEIETPEPVAQPPRQPSPITQPVATVPPAVPVQLPTPQPPVAAVEIIPTPRQAPGLPSQPHIAPQASPQIPLGPSMTQPQIHPQLAAQYNRYAEQQQQQQPQAKSFDSFQHMQQQSVPQQQPPTQPQAQHSQNQPQSYAQYMQPQQQPSHLGIGASSAQEQQYHYYTDRSQPPGFGLYGNSSYMQAQAHAQQEAGASQQRASSGLGGAVESSAQTPTSVPGQVQQPNSRYGGPAGDQGSGHATPSPAPVQASQHQQSMGQYPMQQPFHPYYNQYMHQNFYSQPTPFAKNMYGYPQYMPSQQYPDHTSSPAGLGGFSSPAQGRDSMAGIADYSRMNTSAAQQSLPQNSTAGGYGNGIPNFLGSRGLPQDQQSLGGSTVGQQQGGQPQNDDMKYGENKPPTGPSSAPSLQGQPGRPGSATSGGVALGAQQGGQNPAMYGSHLNPGLHAAHQGQQSGYAQGQSASQYSMYSGGYPPSQYSQGNARHGGTNSGAGWYGTAH